MHTHSAFFFQNLFLGFSDSCLVSCNFRPVGAIFETAFPKHRLSVLPTALWAILPGPIFHRTLDTLWRRRMMKGRSPAVNCPAMLSDWFWRAVCKSGDRYTDNLDKERQLRRETGRGYTLFGAEPGTPEGDPSLSVPAGAIPAPFAP